MSLFQLKPRWQLAACHHCEQHTKHKQHTSTAMGDIKKHTAHTNSIIATPLKCSTSTATKTCHNSWISINNKTIKLIHRFTNAAQMNENTTEMTRLQIVVKMAISGSTTPMLIANTNDIWQQTPEASFINRLATTNRHKSVNFLIELNVCFNGSQIPSPSCAFHSTFGSGQKYCNGIEKSSHLCRQSIGAKGVAASPEPSTHY